VLDAHILNVGTTSVQVEVIGSVEGVSICSACLTYVNLGPDGKKAAI
jgi:hypothetical protein